MRISRGVTVSSLVLFAVACSDSTPTENRPELKAAPRTGATAEWYPTDASGNPDMSAVTSIASEFAQASVTGSGSTFTTTLRGGFVMVASAGEIDVIPTVTKNGGQSEPTTPAIRMIADGSASPASYDKIWTKDVTAVCSVVVSGFADFHTWYVSNGVTWGDSYTTAVATPKTGGGDCMPPSSLVIGIDSVQAGEVFSVQGLAQARVGSITDEVWKLNGSEVLHTTGASPSWTGAIGCGQTSISLTVTNSVPLSATDTWNVVGKCDEFQSTGGGGGGGDGGDQCNGSGEYEWYHWTGGGYVDMGTVCGNQRAFIGGAVRPKTRPAQQSAGSWNGLSGSLDAGVTLIASTTALPDGARVVAERNEIGSFLYVDAQATAEDLALGFGALSLARAVSENGESTLRIAAKGNLKRSSGVQGEINKRRGDLERLRHASVSQVPGVGEVQNLHLDFAALGHIRP